MAKFRKRPIVIEAIRTCQRVEVHTPEGKSMAEPGDWLVVGIKGEIYPCKSEIFDANYEPVEDGARDGRGSWLRRLKAWFGRRLEFNRRSSWPHGRGVGA